MLCLNDELLFKLNLAYVSTLVFQSTVIVLLLADSFRGQSQGARPSQTIVTLVGEDVILPCHLEPAVDVVSKSVEWGRLDLEPRFVHVWHEGQNILSNQNPSYRGRTSVSIEKLKHGDLSLTLSAAKLSDNGIYRCYCPSQSKESTVELIVGSISSAVIAGIYLNSSAVVLQCESAGWYPEPEVLWLDGEGNLLSAGPTETVRGPDDLYTVSSRVTVEKRHSNSFTCRVQQRNINQTRETEIQVSAAYVVWKWRQHKTKDTKMNGDAESSKTEREQLMAERKKMEDLEEKKAKLEEMLQKNEEEEKDLEQVVKTLMEQEEQLKEQRNQTEHQKNHMETNITDIENKLQSVEKMAESDRYHEMKSIVLTAKNQLKSRKQEDEKLHVETQVLLTMINSLLSRMTDRKKAAENYKETLSEQLEEIEKQKKEIQSRL
ncbi:hypothetical protein ABVT39_018377 [Epinephelus coioides]